VSTSLAGGLDRQVPGERSGSSCKVVIQDGCLLGVFVCRGMTRDCQHRMGASDVIAVYNVEDEERGIRSCGYRTVCKRGSKNMKRTSILQW
jgi:hypothetical protein